MLAILRAKLAEKKPTSEALVGEQRQHRRHAVLFSAAIYPIDVYRDIVIHDASPTGVMGEADIELEVGQTIQLSLDQKTFHSGAVQWARGRRFGISLQDRLKISGLSQQIDMGHETGHKPRQERVGLRLAARLYTSQPPHPATVKNLSRRGMLLETSPDLLMGQQLLVRVGDHPLISGRIQWCREGRVGLATEIEVPLLQMIYSGD
jgi:hypothetical protein